MKGLLSHWSMFVLMLTLMTLLNIVYTCTGGTPQVEVQEKTHSEKKTLYFLHLSDFHLDPYYKAASEPSQLCHRMTDFDIEWKNNIIKKEFNVKTNKNRVVPVKADEWGTRGTSCDSPPKLVEKTMDFLGTTFGNNSKVWKSREQYQRQLESPKNISFILWTGDTTRHDRDKLLLLAPSEMMASSSHLVSLFTHHFPSTKIIPSLGNWDVYPPNILEPPPNAMLNQIADIWTPLLGDEKQHFQNYGYYWTDVDGVAIVSLNTLWFFLDNTAVSDCKDNFSAKKSESLKQSQIYSPLQPGDIHLDWLESILYQFNKEGKPAILMGHVPPRSMDNALWYPSCLERFVNIVGTFGEAVVGMYFGHINKDALGLVAKRTTKERYVKEMGKQSDIVENLSFTGKGKDDPPFIEYRLFPISPSESGGRVGYLDKGEKIVTIWTTGASIVPVYNPGFKVGSVEVWDNSGTSQENHESQRAGVIKEHWGYFMDVDLKNAEDEMMMNDQENDLMDHSYSKGHKHPSPGDDTLLYTNSYSTFINYGMEDLSPESVTKWLRLIEKNTDKLRDEYERHICVETDGRKWRGGSKTSLVKNSHQNKSTFIEPISLPISTTSKRHSSKLAPATVIIVLITSIILFLIIVALILALARRWEQQRQSETEPLLGGATVRA